MIHQLYNQKCLCANDLTTAESVAGSKSRAAAASLAIESQPRHCGKKKKLSGVRLCESPPPPTSSSSSSSSSSGCVASAERIEMVARQNGSNLVVGDGATTVTTFSAALMDRVVATSSSAAAAAAAASSSSLPNSQSQMSDRFENGNNLSGNTGISNQSKVNGSNSNGNGSNQPFDGNSMKTNASSNNTIYKNQIQDKNVEFTPKVGNDNFTDKSIKDILRLICQFVRDQGLNNTYEALVEETQIKIENSIAYRLRETVLMGDWVSSFKCLNELFDHELIDRSVMQKIKTSIYEQYFFELVMSKKYLDAALCLNIMVTTAEPNRQLSIMNLSVYLMCSHSEFIRRNNSKKFDVMHYRRLLLNSIQRQLGLDLMLPPDRLKNLILQSFEYQTNNCKFHQSHDTALIHEDFILSDHYCSNAEIPSICHQVIKQIDYPNTEMLRCKFSPCGNYLVIGGEKGHCSLYKMNNNDFELSLLSKIPGISSAIIDIVWSPDSTKFIVIGEREKPDGVVYNLNQKQVQFEFNTLNFSYLHVCDWFPDCQRFIAGGRQGYIYIFTAQGELLKSINGYRVRALKTISNFSFYSVDVLNKVILHDLVKVNPKEIIRLKEKIVSATFNSSKTLLLANINKCGLKMYDLSAIGSFMLRFLPSMSNKVLSLPTFGGDSQKLIASGDENSNNILIWKITEQQPLCELVGHTQIVNQVHWNPKYPGLLASVSDDCSVRIWISESYHNRISCTNASSNTICNKF